MREAWQETAAREPPGILPRFSPTSFKIDDEGKPGTKKAPLGRLFYSAFYDDLNGPDRGADRKATPALASVN